MKKLLSLLLVFALLIPVAALGETVDAVSTASVTDYYGTIMTNADLVASISAYNGFFAVATVNPDNTPNIGFFIFSAAEYEGKLYLQFGLAENQTRANMIAGSAVTAMYSLREIRMETTSSWPMPRLRICAAMRSDSSSSSR